MDLQLNGKTALVTGASEGIGKGIARALAREGVDVAICARRKDKLDAAAAEIAKESGRKIVAIPADLTKDADAKNFVDKGHQALGRVDIMVNNAGSAPGGGVDPAGAHRRGRGSRQPRDDPRLAADAIRERHDHRDRRRPAEAADGPHARSVSPPVVSLLIARQRSASRPLPRDEGRRFR